MAGGQSTRTLRRAARALRATPANRTYRTEERLFQYFLLNLTRFVNTRILSRSRSRSPRCLHVASNRQRVQMSIPERVKRFG